MSQHKTTPAEYALDHDIARHWMREVFRRGGATIDAFIAEMGGWPKLPRTFKPEGPEWEAAEDAISAAAYAGRWWETVALGDEYLRRINAFCDGWRKQMTKAKGVGR